MANYEVGLGYVSDVSFPSDDNEEILNYLQRPAGRSRVINPRQHYFETLDDVDFLRRFRISKVTALSLLEHIEDALEFPYDRNNAIAPMDCLLLTLRFYATGCHLLTAADFAGGSKSSTHRIVHKVTAAIAALRPQYINLPEDPREIRRIQKKFYDVCSFPKVLGAMDCTHIKVQSPGGPDAEMFRNRKGYFSINVQTISDTDLLVRDIVARWPGSVHDTTIFNNCATRAKFEGGHYGDAVLVVDGGYPVRSYLMPPLDRAVTPAQQLYNESQIRTRGCVERQYGVMKRMFPILALGMRVDVSNALNIIVACAVIFNIARTNGDQQPPDDIEDIHARIENGQMPDLRLAVHGDMVGHRRGEQNRNLIINEHFQSLLRENE